MTEEEIAALLASLGLDRPWVPPAADPPPVEPTMTEAEIAAELATLGLDRRWVDLGVLTTEWLSPTGRWRTIALRAQDSPEKMLRQALFNYLKKHRAGVDDSILVRLLEAAASSSEEFSRELAGWNKLTLAQLAQVSRHDASPSGARKLAAQRLRLHAFGAGESVAVSLVGFAGSAAGDGGAPAGVFEVGEPSYSPAFRFGIAWERRLTADEGRRVGGLLGAIPEDAEMRCHQPVFGLRLEPGTSDETRMSLCFQCNNMYLDGGGKRTFSGSSPAGHALLDHLLELSPTAWSRQIRRQDT
jgi:hypothetical protein